MGKKMYQVSPSNHHEEVTPPGSSGRLPEKKTTSSVSLEDYSLFWDQYVKESESYDKETVKGMADDLDALLIFAGLFSAVNTSFIIDSYQDLRPDPMATTNILLTQILQTTNNATSIPQGPAMGSSNAVRVNALFFTSLCCSLLTAFGAVLGKQWLNEYERAGRQRSSYGRGMRRHEKLVGMKQYRLELVVEILPTILQLSLFLFLIALVDYLWALSHVIAFIAIACFGLSLFLYGGATVSSLYDSSSPFTTRFSAMLKAKISKIIPRRRTIDEEVARYRATEQAGQCVAWLRDNATSFLSVSTMAKAATLLPSRLRASLELDAKSIGPSLLRSIISNNAIQLGAVNGSLSSTVSVLHDVLADWVPLQLSVLTETIIHQLHSTIRWTITNDPSSSELIIKVLEKFAYAGDSTPLDPDLLMTYLQILSLDNDGRRAGLKLLWTSMQDPNSDKPRDWPFIKDFRLISKILRYTMWLDGRFTVVDRDEGRFHVRRLWLFKIKPYADRPWARHWLHQFSQYLAHWCQAHPHAGGTTGLLGTMDLFHLLSSFYGSQFSTSGASCLSWEGSLDGNACMAIERLMQAFASFDSSSGLATLLPCLWVHHLVTKHDVPVHPFVFPQYLHSLVTLLSTHTQPHDWERLLGNVQSSSISTWDLDALYSYFRASRSFITPDMNPALCGIQALSRIVTKVHPNQSEEINSIISQTSLLFGSNFEG